MPHARPRGACPVRAVLFDVDDTLIGTRAAMHAAGAAGAAHTWPWADPARVALAGKRFRDDPGGFFTAYTRGELTFAAMREARIGDVARWLGVSPKEGDAGRFVAAYDQVFMRALRPHDDARPCVEALRCAGIEVGLLTNSGEDYTAAKLAATGLADLADVVCTRDTLGFGKPDPRAFHEACRRLGVAPSETAYVGDELGPDALGAHGAGLAAFWLVRDGVTEATALAEAARHGIPVVANLGGVRPEVLWAEGPVTGVAD